MNFALARSFRFSRKQSAAGDSPLELTSAQEKALRTGRWLGRFMDSRWGFGPIRFGAETIVDLIPGVGDLISLGVSLFQLSLAFQLKLPRGKLLRMLLNIAADLSVGLVPVFGDAADTVFKVHLRNQQIIEDHVRRLQAKDKPAPPAHSPWYRRHRADDEAGQQTALTATSSSRTRALPWGSADHA
ncbi:MAG: DUF4112 domain-containing protein [Dehalococcoidia bacterium]